MLSAILLGTVLFTGCEKKTVTSPAAGHMYVASWEDGSSETVYLYDRYRAACQCPKCGRWYNLFGQELLPPEMWEEDY